MAEGGTSVKGISVGQIMYDVSVDIRQLIEAERATNKSADRMATSLTKVAEASKMHAAASGLAATAVREATRSTDAAAASANKAADASRNAAKAADQQAMSAKALAAATRNIPAQATDIFTGLATGQSPLTVLLQQGGQLKDMFGGVGPAARAFGGYIAGLVTPFTAAATAIGVYVYGLVKGKEEMADFTRNLTLTGNQSGVTANQLNALAAELGKTSGIARNQAAEGLNTLVQAGISGERNLGRFTEAAIRLEKAGGPSVAKTADAFRDLAREPVKASEKLNESVNFLTKDLYLQIRALEEQGKKTQAASLAQNAFADAILQRAPQVMENLGTIERGWNAVKDAVNGALSAVAGIGRTPTLKEMQEQLAKAEQNLVLYGGRRREREEQAIVALRQQIAAQADLEDKAQVSAQTAADQAKGARAAAQWAEQGAQFLDKQAKMQREIATARELGLSLGLKDEEIQKRVGQIQASYAEKKQPFDVQNHMLGLSAKAAKEWDRVGIIEEQALRESTQKLTAANASALELEEARTLIRQEAARKRLEIARSEMADLKKDFKTSTSDILALDRWLADQRKKAVEFAAGLTRAVNPVDALRQEYEAKLQLVTQYEEMMALAGVDATARGMEARTEIENQYRLQRQALAEQTFRSQSEENAFLMDSLNALSSTASNAIVGLLNGTMSAQDAMRSLANTVLNEAVGALVQIGLQQLKNALLANTIAAADKARAVANGKAYTASVTAQVAGMTAMAAQNAFAATAAIPIVGPMLAPAAAIAAGEAAASIGAAAVVTAPLAGARQYGGSVDAGSLYRVNETGRPEMFVGSSGQQYMLPTKGGAVVPASKLGAGGDVTVIIENRGTPQQVLSQSYDSEARVARLVVADLTEQVATNTGGFYSALTGATNVRGRL